MGLLSYRFKVKVEGELWHLHMKYSTKGYLYLVKIGDEILAQMQGPDNATEMLKVQRLSFDYKGIHYDVDFGTISIWGYGVHIYENQERIYRTKNKEFKQLKRLIKTSEKLDKMTPEPQTAEEAAKAAEQAALNKELRPSIITDIALGIIFYFVAKKFGLVTAALGGAGVTFVLYFVQKWVKLDLLGGFAKFAVVMSLISVTLTLIFQDDLFIKLKGTFIGAIGVVLVMIDGWKGGNFIGKPMSRYLSGLMKITPKRAAFALGVSSFILILVDLPLAFILTTDQWIFYNTFLDTFIAMPILFTCMWIARTKPSETNT